MTASSKAEERDAIIAKVRACLNLGKAGANTTEHEMATALAMAKRLMAKFQLTEADVLATPETRAQAEMANRVVPTRQNPHLYEQQLAAGVVSVLFHVRPLIEGLYDEKLKKYRKVIRFYGMATDVMLAASAFELLRNVINDMALRCPYKLSERDQWRVGVVMRLSERVKEADDELKAAEAAQCRALVVTKNQLVDDYVAEQAGPLRKARRRSFRRTEAYLRGKRDGNKIDLDFSKEDEQGGEKPGLLGRQ